MSQNSQFMIRVNIFKFKLQLILTSSMAITHETYIELK